MLDFRCDCGAVHKLDPNKLVMHSPLPPTAPCDVHLADPDSHECKNPPRLKKHEPHGPRKPDGSAWTREEILLGFDSPEFQETWTGKFVRVPNLIHTDIHYLDIAAGLAQTARHGGHCVRKISVAQHCVMGYDLMVKHGFSKSACFAFLMHDAEEYLMGDMPRPIKYRAGMEWYRETAKELKRRVRKKYGVSRHYAAECREYDELMLHAEVHQWKRTQSRGRFPKDAREPKIVPWTWEIAMREFVDRFLYHFPGERDARFDDELPWTNPCYTCSRSGKDWGALPPCDKS